MPSYYVLPTPWQIYTKLNEQLSFNSLIYLPQNFHLQYIYLNFYAVNYMWCVHHKCLVYKYMLLVRILPCINAKLRFLVYKYMLLVHITVYSNAKLRHHHLLGSDKFLLLNVYVYICVYMNVYSLCRCVGVYVMWRHNW